MTIVEMLAFEGKPEQFEEYSALLMRAERLSQKVNRLSNRIMDEDDSLSVFEGELTDKDRALIQRHVDERQRLEGKLAKTKSDLDTVKQQIQSMTTKGGSK